jgi:hypothetical protein
MDHCDVSAELSGLIDELDDRVAFVLRGRGSVLAWELDRHPRPVESVVDDLFLDGRCDERSIRIVREAVAGLRAICARLPDEFERAVDRSAYDRLRALRIDLDLKML